MSNTDLVDIHGDYPREPGASFRTLQLAQCAVCGSKTNLAQISTQPVYSLRFTCPHSATCWHHEIDFAMRASDEAKAEQLRTDYADRITHDVVGTPEETPLCTCITFSWMPGSSCTHAFPWVR